MSHTNPPTVQALLADATPAQDIVQETWLAALCARVALILAVVGLPLFAVHRLTRPAQPALHPSEAALAGTTGFASTSVGVNPRREEVRIIGRAEAEAGAALPMRIQSTGALDVLVTTAGGEALPGELAPHASHDLGTVRMAAARPSAEPLPKENGR